MLIEKIQHNPESIKQKITPLSSVLTGYIKVDLQKAWVSFIEKFEPYRWFVTLPFLPFLVFLSQNLPLWHVLTPNMGDFYKGVKADKFPNP